MLRSILALYGIDANDCTITPFGTGLINHTWKITNGDDEYILQRINHHVFKNPFAIDENMRNIAAHLRLTTDHYLFVEAQPTLDAQTLVQIPGEGYFRMLPFVKDSYTYDIVESPSIAYEAALQFGCFAKHIARMDIRQLKITLPDFHNLLLRYEQFESALINGNKERIAAASSSIAFIKEQKDIVDIYRKVTSNPEFRIRATHHDTKISNVLFDETGKGLSVIDLDTTMPGYFLSDVGDMMRTYLSPVSEEEKDTGTIFIRDEYFVAIARGYLECMRDELSQSEKEHFVFAGALMIYMQSLRFLTDHINNDIYYGARYEGHNLYRANNQIQLLKRYLEKKDRFEAIVHTVLKDAAALL